ncbi:putative glutathione S-transferase [Apostasia shenzhenica]|uniref:glutathione transferase n=1 Tax=Apostasia shenzhenica TaxID=1088818 RepID=A0A2I0BCS9_9ASPA|nr:putative glutathione S-transferase [Apostasia shenzhenica]
MAGDEVKLLGTWASPYSERVRVGLKLKGVSYNFADLDIRPGKPKSPELLRYNPAYKKIPILLHHGQPIAESLVILEFVDDQWAGEGPSLLPKDPYQRALARFWAKFFDDKCIRPLWMSLWTEGEKQKGLMAEAKANLSIIEGELEGKKFFGGEEIGIVDVAVICSLYWIDVVQEAVGVSVLDSERHPAACRWMKDLLGAGGAVNGLLPPREKLRAYFEADKEGFRARMNALYG